ncbi:cytochrome b-c1 complex subunit 1, mitochondrial [Helicoverpa armigera]|uniref:cytochrome b-c1 complex subunit 1, mitochondrial n=1 Tax=Helicoverpa armigera TaxID=29058 RepID=UPI003083EBD1
MLKTVSKYSRDVSRRWRRRYSWCPEAPVDPSLKVSILPNGVRIATERRREAPLACVCLTVAAGPRYETPCTNGLTHFIEHMAFKGFQSEDKAALEEALISMGAKMTVRTTRELQVFSVIIPSVIATRAIDKLHKIVTELDLKDCEMNQERCNIDMELEDADADPKQVVFDYLHATAFQGTPLGQRVIGTSENLERFDADMVSSFMCEQYQPYKLVLSTSGDVSHDAVMSFAEPRFGGIPPQPCIEPENSINRYTGSQVIYRDDSMPFCHVAIAFEAPGYSSSKYYFMLLMKYIIGSWDRSQGGGVNNAPFVARAASTFKSCERYHAFYTAYRDVGLFGVYFVSDRLLVDEALFSIQEQFMHLCTMTHQGDLDRGINHVRLKLARKLDSVVKSSQDIGKQLMYTNRRKLLHDIDDSLCMFRVQNLKDLAMEVFYDKCPVVASVGPSETLPEYNRIRSGQWWFRV